MHSFRYFILILSLIVPCLSMGGILRGTVCDSQGQPMPFATVYVKGTTQGTAANAQGVYQLTLPDGTYTIICQFISYKQELATVTIAGNETITRNFTLREQSLEIKEVVVRTSE